MPGTTELTTLVFETARSADGVRVSLSVAELSPATGSVMPAAGAAVAVLASVPVVAGPIAVTTVKVAVVPTGRPTVVLIDPLPDAVVQLAPALGAQLHEANVAPAGWASVTIVTGALDGPLLATVMVYVVD